MRIYNNEFELLEIEPEEIYYLYSIRNNLNFLNAWHFSSRIEGMSTFIKELEYLFKDNIIHKIFIIKYRDVRIGVIWTYGYNIITKETYISIYIEKEKKLKRAFIISYLSILKLYVLCFDLKLIHNTVNNKFVDSFSILDKFDNHIIKSKKGDLILFTFDEKNIKYLFEKYKVFLKAIIFKKY